MWMFCLAYSRYMCVPFRRQFFFCVLLQILVLFGCFVFTIVFLTRFISSICCFGRFIQDLPLHNKYYLLLAMYTRNAMTTNNLNWVNSRFRLLVLFCFVTSNTFMLVNQFISSSKTLITYYVYRLVVVYFSNEFFGSIEQFFLILISFQANIILTDTQ